MAQLNTYYLDGTTLLTSTSVFQDAALTIVAADGWYSDSTNYRQLINGILGPVVSCPSCSVACGTGLSFSGTNGLFQLDYSLGTDLGAIIVYFNPQAVVDGIQTKLGSTIYNNATSPQFGYVGSGARFNFLGDQNATGAADIGPTLDLGGYTNQDFYLADSSGAFPQTPTNQNGTVQGTSADVNTTTATPSYCTIVIPRTDYTNSSITILVFGPPGTSTAWNVDVNCPVLLTSTPSGNKDETCEQTSTYPNLIYVAPNYNGTAGEPAVHEFAFRDASGVTLQGAGTYVINPPSGKKQITVSSDGVITNVITC